jgi:hypothetical protein
MKRTVIFAALALAVVFSSCLGKNKKAEGEAAAPADITVASDKAIEIFNGEDFTGWRGYNQEGMPASGRWTVEDGAMKINGNGRGEGNDNILYTTPFKNFNFTFEYKVAKGSNSGIFFYVKEIPSEEGPYYITAPEYQILDNANHLDATQGVDGNRQSASLYDMIPAKPQNAKPFGEWNTGEIRVFKGTVIHYQNGEKVAEYHLWTPEWNALIDNSKFSSTQTTWPTAYKHLTELGLDAAGNVVGGYILLQDHGDDVWFRNLKVEETN